MPYTRRTKKTAHADALTPVKGRLELKLRESKNVGTKSVKAVKAAVVIDGVTGEGGSKKGTRRMQKVVESMVDVIEETPREKQVEHSNDQTVKTAKVDVAQSGKKAKFVTSTPNENVSGSIMRGRKRKAVEAPEEAQEKEKEKENENKPVPMVIITVSKKDTARLRKRTKTLITTEAEANGPATKAPQKDSAVKSKTPRLTRNAALLSIAASSLGQTTLSAPPALACSQSTISSDEPPTQTKETAATVSTLNTVLTASTKLGEKSSSEAKRPEYLSHIINLHSHLLTAIHLHRAQNGITSSPVFASLRPHLERLSRRVVELADLRRICWISGFDLNESTAPAEADAEVEKEQNRKRRRKGKGTRENLTNAKEEDDDRLKVPKGWLKVVDYGNGRVVVELVTSMAGVGEVNKLRREFEKRVDAMWSTKQLSVKGKEEEEQGQVLEFAIPMAEIIVSENRKLVDTVLKAKGQQRLSDMKGVGVIRGKAHEEKSISRDKKLSPTAPAPIAHNTSGTTPTPVEEAHEKDSQTTEDPATTATTTTTSTVKIISPASTPNTAAPAHSTTLLPSPDTCTPTDTTSTAAKKLSLLDRIRAKHQATLLQASTSPTANLSPEETRLAHLRLCAQQRLPEIIPILRALRLRASGGGIGGVGVGGGKRSLSLEEAVTAVRQSMRGSISWDETEMCIRLAGEMGGTAVAGGGSNVHLAGKIPKSALTNTVANITNTNTTTTTTTTTAVAAPPMEEKGKGGLLSKWGGTGILSGANRDETGWVEVVECGGLKAVVFK